MVVAFQTSGLSMNAFAKKHGMSAHRVQYWLRKEASAGAGFAEVAVSRPGRRDEVTSEPGPVEVSDAVAALELEVRLSSGRSLVFRGTWSPTVVAAHVRALEAQ